MLHICRLFIGIREYSVVFCNRRQECHTEFVDITVITVFIEIFWKFCNRSGS